MSFKVPAPRPRRNEHLKLCVRADDAITFGEAVVGACELAASLGGVSLLLMHRADRVAILPSDDSASMESRP